MVLGFFFFFKQKTAYEIYQCDWSSDVCSSDLVDLVTERLQVPERRACRVLSQPRTTQRRMCEPPDDEESLTGDIVDLATQFGRYGYRRVTALLKAQGWRVNHKRVERIWRREGLKVPKKQPKRGRLWLNDGSCIRLRPQRPNHVWAYDFVSCRTHDGRAVRMLTLIDEFSRECLAIRASRHLKADNILEILTELFILKGVPEHIRSDNGPEFTAKAVRNWLPKVGVQTLFIQPGSPWENGYIESFNGKLRDEILNREVFYSLKESKVLVEDWRLEYNNRRPHSGLGYMTPAAFAASCISSASPTAQLQQYTTEQMDNSLIKVGT